jgi:hypothetical protein
MDGVEPVSLVTDEWRQMFLETFEAFSNEMAFRDEDGEDEDFHILMPHDLSYFIEYADGVEDPDFRMSSMPRLHPVFAIGNRRDKSASSESAADISMFKNA